MENTFEEIRKEIIRQLIDCAYMGDISDIGNEIGIVIGNFTEDEIADFKIGIEHGISLTKGTH